MKKINERKEFCDAETLNQQKWKYEFYTILANVICFEKKIRLLKEKILKKFSGPVQSLSLLNVSHRRKGLYIYLLQHGNRHAQAARPWRQEMPISWQTDHFGVTFFAFSQIPVFGHQSTSKLIINATVTIFISMAITWPISVHKIKIKKITRFDITYVNTKKKKLA